MKNKSLTQILKFARSTMYVARKSGTQEKTADNLRYSIHVLTKCPFYARNRRHYLGRAILEEEEMKNKSLTQILKFARATRKWTLTNCQEEETSIHVQCTG